jgi:hypothetical protein
MCRILRYNRRHIGTPYEVLVVTHFVHRTYDIRNTFRKHGSNLTFGMWIIFLESSNNYHFFTFNFNYWQWFWVPTRKEISIIVSCRVPHRYLIYRYLSCPRLDMKEKKTQLFRFSTSFDWDLFLQIFFEIGEFAEIADVLLKTNGFKLRILIFLLNSLSKVVKIILNFDFTSGLIWSFFIFDDLVIRQMTIEDFKQNWKKKHIN